MNRTDLIGLETDRCQRRITAPFELRQDSNNGALTFRGVASTTDTPYDVYGGAPYGWTETVASGAFKRTLANSADVVFLVNHEGMSLARTKSGTMSLREDNRGLAVSANLDPNNSASRDLYSASKRGDVDEMSFAFRVVADEWTDAEGNPASMMDGVNRRITEINLNKGDVSAVNYGANPTTSGGFREMQMALSELRDGKEPNEEQRSMIRRLARLIGETPELETNDAELERLSTQLATIESAVEGMRASLDTLASAPEGPVSEGFHVTEMSETVAILRAHWEQLGAMSAV
jgi:HK97 family phage prohead protease